ncbi:MAG: hypothetical protein PHU21_07360 [Elusimicrobia bacterium]|nr:hypothetical protein [Elusimicrobiota bacterium]
MKKTIAAVILLLGLGVSGARAQVVGISTEPVAFGTSTSTVVSLASYLGAKLSRERGPWVLGEVLFFSRDRLVSDYTWREAVRGRRGSLYTNADIDSDMERLLGLKKFDKVEAGLYEIPGVPVPQEYQGVAVSTSEVRLVFFMTEKFVVGASTKAARPLAPAAVSGVVLTPTAYRGAGRYTTPGMGLDINAAYYIGRLYGKNSYPLTPAKTNYIDRLGVWLLTADGKMQVQSETAWRPAMAVGVQATALLRDSPQPQINQTPTLTVKATNGSTQILSDAFVVLSKKFGPARTSMGVMLGDMGNLPGNLSEFLTPEALKWYRNDNSGTVIRSKTVPFASLLFIPKSKPAFPLGVEVMKFNGSPMNPWLINFKVGYFLRLNFDVAYLKYQGGYDVIGVLQFRYNYFPSR